LRAAERPSYILSMAIVLWIAAVGALGSALHHFVNVSAGRLLGMEFPWGTGILGGFTTFSTFSLDFATLFERRAFELAGTYAAASVALSILAIFAGLWLTRALLQ